jgi:hypothetical protein
MKRTEPSTASPPERTDTEQLLAAAERKLQVEGALDRIRARTTAMHHSDELSEVAVVLFQQLRRLGITPDRTLIPIVDERTDTGVAWMTAQGGEQVTHGVEITFTGHPVLEEVYRQWKNNTPFIHQELSGDTLAGFISWIQKESNTPFTEIPERRIYGYASFSHGMVAIAQESPIPEETREILIRFARVFEQTYIRFLDLQRAEFQALDAKRRASLDRIRGEIASMRTADDLQTITPLIWRELTTLGVPFFRCGLFIMDDENETIHSFLTTPTGEHLAELRLPYNHGDTTTAIVDHWRCCKVYFERWDREQFVAWAMSLIDHGLLEDRLQYQGADEPPACLSLHFIPFTQGVLYIGGEDTLSEDTVDLVQSLAHAFSVAYAR